MANLNKIILTLLVTNSCAVYAGSLGKTCTNDSITIPCEHNQWGLGAKALYLKPAYTGELGTIGAVNFNVANAAERYIDTDPNWTWGFQLEAAHYLNAGKDANLNWYHLIAKTTTTNINDINAPTNYGFLQRGTETHSIKPKWDAVNLELGQLINLTHFKYFRVHGGAQYTSIKAKTSLDGYDSFQGFSSGNDMHTAKASTTYAGFGPRAGIDMNYPLIEKLDIYANIASALLAGTSKFYRAYVDNIGNAPGFPSNSSAIRTGVVVPEFEGKLGATYSKVVGQGALSLDVGYMWVTYISPLHFSQWKPVGNNQALNVANRVDSESNFTLNGSYLGLKWVGMV